MQVDILIVGQGLCGSWLSYECRRAGLHTLVIDRVDPQSPSRLSAGIINPITGRRHVEVWLADELLSQSEQSYQDFGKQLGQTLIRKTSLLDHFPSEQMRDNFTERIKQGGRYVSMSSILPPADHPLNHPFGIGQIDPVLVVDLAGLLDGWRSTLIENHALIDEAFEPDRLSVQPNFIQYKNIHADWIIFCDGTSHSANRFFPSLPFAPNKGEVLILDIPGLSDQFIYKQGLLLAPLSNGLWWAGSSYQWSFNNTDPTEEFLRSTEQSLRNWLRIPFNIVDHRAAVRPATTERRPFVGLHPTNNRLGILNGMGTKGCSLAPYFARQLVQHMQHGTPIHPEAAVSRFVF